MLKPDLLYEHTLRAFEDLAARCEIDAELAKAVQCGVAAAKRPRKPGKEVAALVDAAVGSPDPWP